MRRPAILAVALAAAALGSLGLPAAASAGNPSPSGIPAVARAGTARVGSASGVDSASGTDSALGSASVPGADSAGDAYPGSGGMPIRIMPLGDSITYGIGPAVDNGYRADLHDRLTRAGLDVDFVGSVQSGDSADPDNEGHPGWTIEQISAEVDTWIADARPDVILLHAGTNDMRASATTSTAPAALAALLDQIAADAPQAQVFVAEVTGAGTTANRPMWKRRLDNYNARIPAIVDAEGPHFHLVDQSDVGGIDLTDIVHPNTFGYAKMAWNWYQAMMPVLDPDDASWPETGNPYAQTIADRCIDESSGDIAVYGLGCRTWYLRAKTTGSAVRTWQLPVRVTSFVRVVKKSGGRPAATMVKVTTLRWIQGY